METKVTHACRRTVISLGVCSVALKTVGCGGLMVSTQVRQSNEPGFKSGSGQYCGFAWCKKQALNIGFMVL